MKSSSEQVTVNVSSMRPALGGFDRRAAGCGRRRHKRSERLDHRPPVEAGAERLRQHVAGRELVQQVRLRRAPCRSPAAGRRRTAATSGLGARRQARSPRSSAGERLASSASTSASCEATTVDGPPSSNAGIEPVSGSRSWSSSECDRADVGAPTRIRQPLSQAIEARDAAARPGSGPGRRTAAACPARRTRASSRMSLSYRTPKSFAPVIAPNQTFGLNEPPAGVLERRPRPAR